MQRTAIVARPTTIRQAQVLFVAAIATRLRRCIETINLDDTLSPLQRDPFKDRDELSKAQVGHFTSPKGFHTRETEVFKTDHVGLVAERVCQLEVPISTLIGKAAVQLRHPEPRCLVVVGSFLFARELRRKVGHPIQRCLERLWSLVAFALVVRQEVFQSEIKSHSAAVTAYFHRFDIGDFDRKTKPEIATTIPLDRHGFNGTLNRTALDEPMRPSTDADPAIAEIFPSRLLEREGSVESALLEGRLTCLLILKETLVRFVETLAHILHRLRAEALPVRVASSEFSDVLHQTVDTQVLSVESVVSARQRHRMIPDRRRRFDLSDQMLVLLGTVEAIFQRLVHTAIYKTLVFKWVSGTIHPTPKGVGFLVFASPQHKS